MKSITIDKKLFIYFAKRTRLNHKYFVLASLKERLILVTNSLNEKYMSEIAYFLGDIIRVGGHYQQRG